MRKVFLFMMVTLDGYFEGVDHDLSWHNTDDEFMDYSDKQLDECDTIVFGRKTYDMMASYWPAIDAHDEDYTTAQQMNRLHKIVFTHELFEPEWENTEVSTNLTKKIMELKAMSGKDIAVFGSSNLGKAMIEADLLDEVRLIINPVFIGNGSTLFKGLEKKFQLFSTRTFKNGNVLLIYR